MQAGFSRTILFAVAYWLVCGLAAIGATPTPVERDVAPQRGGQAHFAPQTPQNEPVPAQTPHDHRGDGARPVPDRSGAMARRIDALLADEWKAAGVEPAPAATDGEFLRRAYLDLTGVIPRASDVREFLADERPDKRELLVDRLIESPRYATHMATTWRNRILPTGVSPERGREASAMQKWLRTRFAKNLRYDNLVGELLLTIGGDELGPALYYQANDLSPEKLAGSSAELFLGVRLHCAQCHDHPFADWSQRDFWGLAAFFARVKARDDRNMGMMDARYRLYDAEVGDVMLPESAEVVAPKFPKGNAASDDSSQTRRVQLAIWMTSTDNKYFSRAAVNWAWSHLFGRGLMESLDELGEPGATQHAQLLDELSIYFVRSGYNLRELWRTLATTQAYGLSSQHGSKRGQAHFAAQTAQNEPVPAQTPGARPVPELFAYMLAKPLTPEQLYDSFVLLAPENTGQDRSGAGQADMAAGLDEDPARVEFVRRMRPPPGTTTEFRAGTLQALMLMNGRVAAGVSDRDGSSLLGAIDAPFMSDDERIESLFMATLSRPPDADERAACIESLGANPNGTDRNAAMSDILWALVNSTEFAFNH